ncbi:hypothetical protein DCAR_0520170 [Daucus carota subsp. sativus]|uniref:Uncharacterized protein n=1 Tax=Daucus carota subsp. sativus TaxID=79200 RepID=A0A161YLE6_DAUCS|nr:PREDICTED: uncharacterized protein LOC108222287 [Daucus carota subsp. sativus]WOH00795.1 hypothetical protein DCAR_0520170 [Daucus carota subsp. sativus]
MAEAEKASKVDRQKDNDQDEEKWVKYYSSNHEILLVGEGDFSFSTCLAQAFGSASNIVASSLDSYDDVIKNYKKAGSNFSILDKLGASRFHGVDATKMKFHSDLKMRKFDRIIFNFPHAGFTHKGRKRKEDDNCLIMKHKRLLDGFFKNACGMLRPDGEIHVNHKTSFPYYHWNLEKLASQNSLRLIECVAFNKEDYLGYENKRGSGKRCNDCFLLGECCTFKFSFFQNAKVTKVKRNVKRLRNLKKALKLPQEPSPCNFGHHQSDLVPFMNDTPALNVPCGRPRELLQPPIYAYHQENYLERRQPHELFWAPIPAYQQINYLEFRQPALLQAPLHAFQQGNYLIFSPPPSGFDLRMSSIPDCMESPHFDHIYWECARIFSPYFERVAESLKNGDHYSSCFLEEALNVGYEIYMAGDPRRTLRDYRYMLEQLRKYVVGRPERQVSRQLSTEYDFASNSSRHFRS